MTVQIPRRTLLKSATATAGLAALPATLARAQTPAATPEDAKANALWDRLMTEVLDHSPETVTSLGLDSGPRAAQKSQLDDASIAGLHDAAARNAADLAALRAIDRTRLTGLNPANLDSLLYGAEVNDGLYKLGYDQIGSPYAVSQLTAATSRSPISSTASTPSRPPPMPRPISPACRASPPCSIRKARSSAAMSRAASSRPISSCRKPSRR